MPPTTIEVIVSRATPTTGSRHEWVQMEAMKSAAVITAATARIALVGSTAWASM